MERQNLSGIIRICGADTEGKVYRLLDFTDRPGDISDPWFTGNFDSTYEDVREGYEALLAYLNGQKINHEKEYKQGGGQQEAAG